MFRGLVVLPVFSDDLFPPGLLQITPENHNRFAVNYFKDYRYFVMVCVLQLLGDFLVGAYAIEDCLVVFRDLRPAWREALDPEPFGIVARQGIGGLLRGKRVRKYRVIPMALFGNF